MTERRGFLAAVLGLFGLREPSVAKEKAKPTIVLDASNLPAPGAVPWASAVHHDNGNISLVKQTGCAPVSWWGVIANVRGQPGDPHMNGQVPVGAVGRSVDALLYNCGANVEWVLVRQLPPGKLARLEHGYPNSLVRRACGACGVQGVHVEYVWLFDGAISTRLCDPCLVRALRRALEHIPVELREQVLYAQPKQE